MNNDQIRYWFRIRSGGSFGWVHGRGPNGRSWGGYHQIQRSEFEQIKDLNSIKWLTSIPLCAII